MAAAGRSDARLIYLLEIQLTSPSALTLRFCDGALSAQRYLAMGQEWEPVVIDWGELAEAMNAVNLDGRPSTAAITISNTALVGATGRKLHELMRSPFNTGGTYEWAFAKAIVRLLLDPGHDVSDVVALQTFYLEEPDEIGETTITLKMSDAALMFEDKLAITKISRDLFPFASPAVVGREVPRAFGTIKNVKAIPVVDGISATLSADITAAATSLTLDDASGLPATGTLQIDAEHLSYTVKNGNAISGITRGANSTKASAHTAASRVYEVRSGTNAYRYVVCEHDATFPTKAISNVRVNGVAPKTAPTIQLDAADIATGRRFAAISFSPADVELFHTIPAGEAQIIAVTSLSIVGDGVSGVDDFQTVTIPLRAEVGSPNTRRIAWRVTSSAALAASNWFAVARRPTPGSGVGQTDIVRTSGNGTSTEWKGSDSRDFATTDDEELVLSSLAGSLVTVTCEIIEYAVAYRDRPNGEFESTAGRLIGDVTCDVQGIQDSAGGAISGTASLLLENPADITKFIHRYLYPGVADADLGSSFTTTRAKLVNAGYKWGFLLYGETYATLRRKLAEQARSLLYIEGGLIEYRFLDGAPASSLTLDWLAATDGKIPAKITKTPRTDVRTRITAFSGRDYTKSGELSEIYSRITTRDDLGQPGLADPINEDLELSLVQDANTALSLAEYWLAWWKRQRFETDIPAFWNVIDIEKADHLALDNHPIIASHGDDALIWRTVQKTYKPADVGRTMLHLVDTYVDVGLGDLGDDMWGSRGNSSKNNSGTPNTQFDLVAAAVRLRNSSNQVVIRHNPGTITCNVSTAGPAANGRDQAGAFSASSFIHFYWIWDPTSQTLATLASATAPPTGPTLPSGYTYWCYMGAVYFDAGSAMIRTTYAGSWAQRTNVELTNTAVTVATEQSGSGSAIWPANALAIGGTWSVALNAASDTASLRAESGVDSGITLEAVGASSTGLGGPFRMNIQSQTLFWIQSAAASRAWRIEVSQYQVPNGGE